VDSIKVVKGILVVWEFKEVNVGVEKDIGSPCPPPPLHSFLTCCNILIAVSGVVNWAAMFII
jgi:hypothetical protein